MAFVVPTQDMIVRPGQHVSVDGRVYHPYIAHWEDEWRVSILAMQRRTCLPRRTYAEPSIVVQSDQIAGNTHGYILKGATCDG